MKNVKSVSNAAELTAQAAAQRQLDNNRLLLTLWLVFEAGLFGSLIYANFVVRAAQGQWPPLGVDRMSMGTPLALTVALLVSSVTAIQAVGALRRNDRANFTRFMIATLVLGVGFVVGVVSLLMHIPFSGPYNAFFVAMWFVHVSHAIAVLLYLGYVLRRATQGHYTATAHWPVEAATYLWHFLDIMWIVLFVVLYLV
ncbi:MAG: cytochrome c oxidase subunit 3 [Aggregatilineales bacterium]